MATYWQAELTRGNGSYDADFPHRQTRTEAEADARDALARLTDNERRMIGASVRQFEGDDEDAESIGRAISVTL